MRAVLGVLGLLLTLAAVMFVARQQVQVVAPAEPGASSAEGSVPTQQVEAARQAVQRAVELGAARASDANP